MTLKEFKLLCTIGGNDYFKNEKNIFYYLKLHKKFKKKENSDWFSWLKINNHLNLIEEDVSKTLMLFDVKTNELSNYKYFIVKNGRYDKEEICNQLTKERFIF